MKETLDLRGNPQKVEKELMIAEGSDWFWWYGNDHYTPIKDEFDALFRKHLINIYTLFGEEVPTRLSEPIMQKSAGQREPPAPHTHPSHPSSMAGTPIFSSGTAAATANWRRNSRR